MEQSAQQALTGQTPEQAIAGINEQRQSLANQANELEQQAQFFSEKWGAGGTYRQITSALMAGVSGNIGASSGTWVQGAAVNYIQQNLAGEIGQLVAQGHLTEGSPLHAIIAGAGAAASLLTNLFDLPTPETTEEERTTKRHLITTLVSGITVAAGGDVAAANTAALANVDNNWLASEQKDQFAREVAQISIVGYGSVLHCC